MSSDPYSDRGNKDLSLGNAAAMGQARPVKEGGRARPAPRQSGS